MKVTVRNAFQRKRVRTEIDIQDMTQQQFKDEVDVNFIVDSYASTKNPAILNRTQENYGYAPAKTFHEAMNIVLETEEKFESLPSEIRDYFNSDVNNYLEAMQEPDFEKVMQKLGTQFVGDSEASGKPQGSNEPPTERSEGGSVKTSPDAGKPD